MLFTTGDKHVVIGDSGAISYVAGSNAILSVVSSDPTVGGNDSISLGDA